MNPKTAQQGPACRQVGFAPPLLIGVGAFVLLIVILVASGALKFSGSIKVNKTGETTGSQVQQEQKGPSLPFKLPFKPSLTQTYNNSSPAYSIKYPGDWAVEKQSGTAIALYNTKDGATTTSDSEGGMLITATPLPKELVGVKLTTVIDLTKNQVKSQFPGANFLSEKDTKVGSYEAYVYDFTTVRPKGEYRAKFYFMLDKNDLYGLIVTSPSNKWQDYEETFGLMLESFKLPQ